MRSYWFLFSVLNRIQFGHYPWVYLQRGITIDSHPRRWSVSTINLISDALSALAVGFSFSLLSHLPPHLFTNPLFPKVPQPLTEQEFSIFSSNRKRRNYRQSARLMHLFPKFLLYLELI